MTETFGSVLRRWRDSRGMSQKEAAAILGVSERSISRWEQGDGLPIGETFVLLGHLGCDLSQLVDRNGDSQLLDRTQPQIGSSRGHEQVPSAIAPHGVRYQIDADLIANIETLLEEWLGRHERRMEPRQRGRFIAEAYAFCMEEVARAEEPVDGVATRVVGRLLRLVA